VRSPTGHNGPVGKAISIYADWPNISPIVMEITLRGKAIPRQREKNAILPEK
jgi:hypothetical protein